MLCEDSAVVDLVARPNSPRSVEADLAANSNMAIHVKASIVHKVIIRNIYGCTKPGADTKLDNPL